MDTSFFDLGIDPALVKTLEKQGISEPFEVQLEAIPDAMLGHDICCRAPTGSGKTLAFGLPLISRTPRADPEFPTALILSPTRELAEQICTVLKPLAATFDLEVMAIYGGVPYGRQRKALSRGTDIVVACPGRLLDLLDNGALSLEDVGMVVLDEADRMADMGFMEPVCNILDRCAQNRQTVLFSATLDDEVGDLVENYLYKPVTIEVGPKEVSMESMEHFFWLMKNSMKPGIASEAIRKCGRTVVFCRTRRGVDRVGRELVDEGISVATIHGGLDQKKRDRAMAQFVEGRCMALVATDVAARGIDVEGINCIIHYDPPENGKTYKHRSGRTARAGSTGTVISFVQNPQRKMCNTIQKEVGIFVKFSPPDFNDLPKYDVQYIPPPRRKEKPRKPKRDAKRARFHNKSSRRQDDRRSKRKSNHRRRSSRR
ncbi:MAG: DEAD/DEAH box helicase [Candidatus Thermoplasmatota archaeon]|nr:DEAD/DEAH box helicase [Candidatus Thermoplasmatota archaeon]